MSDILESTAVVNGHQCRILEKGQGPTIGYLAGLFGLPNWNRFLDELAQTYRVIAPSLPGFPGADGHEELDDLLDWVTALLDLIDQAGLRGADVIGSSCGAMLAAELAALSPGTVRNLVLIAPLGLHHNDLPVPHLWARRSGELGTMLCNHSQALGQFLEKPAEVSEPEWRISQMRCQAAGARLLWPTCDLGLSKRLHRISAATLLVWGDQDRIVDIGYQGRFAEKLGGPVQLETIEGAGHMVEIDAPIEAAAAIDRYLRSRRAEGE